MFKWKTQNRRGGRMGFNDGRMIKIKVVLMCQDNKQGYNIHIEEFH